MFFFGEYIRYGPVSILRAFKEAGKFYALFCYFFSVSADKYNKKQDVSFSERSFTYENNIK